MTPEDALHLKKARQRREAVTSNRASRQVISPSIPCLLCLKLFFSYARIDAEGGLMRLAREERARFDQEMALQTQEDVLIAEAVADEDRLMAGAQICPVVKKRNRLGVTTVEMLTFIRVFLRRFKDVYNFDDLCKWIEEAIRAQIPAGTWVDAPTDVLVAQVAGESQYDIFSYQTLIKQTAYFLSNVCLI